MSFVRKRITQTRRGPTTTYQLVHTYRDGDKVRQRIVGLGLESTPTSALARFERLLANQLQSLADYEAGSPKAWRFHRTGKSFARAREKHRRDAARLRARVDLLRGVVSEMSPMGPKTDTTGRMSTKGDKTDTTVRRRRTT